MNDKLKSTKVIPAIELAKFLVTNYKDAYQDILTQPHMTALDAEWKLDQLIVDAALEFAELYKLSLSRELLIAVCHCHQVMYDYLREDIKPEFRKL